MKFARLFQEHLANDGYPPDWVDSAISYGQLKKCIKRVQKELVALGLDADTLHQLLSVSEAQQKLADSAPNVASTAVQDDDARRGSAVSTESTEEKQAFQYRFEAEESRVKKGLKKHIVPKLQFVVDAKTGQPISAGLSPETKNYLHQLAITEDLTAIRITPETFEPPDVPLNDDTPTRLIQIPLTTDSEFFHVLETELTGLAALQQSERQKLENEITGVGTVLSSAIKPDSKSSKKDLEKWRRLFECYIEAQVFFATNERDHGARGSAAAARNFATFMANAQKAKLLKGWKTKESALAFRAFMAINDELLQALKFQEINNVAMTKILKKFDKRTALGASTTFSTALPATLLAPDLSRALASAVSSEILAVIPQLDDYLCPICMTLAYRPVRLSCGHLFCIRCMVLMQRQKKKQCALCREENVMSADSGNLDSEMIKFLMTWFPKEVKEKQRDIDKQISIEQFGEQPECVLM